MSKETEIVLTFAVLLGLLILSIFLLLGIRKDRRRAKEDKAIILDGLLTKSRIVSEINSCLSKANKDQSFTLINIQIDNFEETINAFGKLEAKKALERVAYYMNRSLPKRVLMGNIQMTGFLVLLKCEYDRMQSLEVAKKLLGIISKPIKIYQDTFINMTASIGIAFYPIHGTKYKELAHSLEIAVNQAKEQGGNSIIVYGDENGEKSGDLKFHLAIKSAMENKEFVLYYQPIINIEKEEFYGLEALVRWNHPQQGLISPQSFLDIMEQSGDIKWIGNWGLETLIQEYYEIRRQFPHLNYQITFNLSVRQLLNETVASDFNRLIKKYKMKPEIIILEIADFSAFQKYTVIKHNISKLKKIGFKISLNAYGIDSNTLLSLNKMPIDVIKLDRQFFNREEESYLKDRLLSLIVDYSNKNHKDVIAEGIEDQEMLEFCRENNIKLVQGYYFSKPVSSSDIVLYVQDESWVKEQKIPELPDFEDDFEEKLDEYIDYDKE